MAALLLLKNLATGRLQGARRDHRQQRRSASASLIMGVGIVSENHPRRGVRRREPACLRPDIGAVVV